MKKLTWDDVDVNKLTEFPELITALDNLIELHDYTIQFLPETKEDEAVTKARKLVKQCILNK